MNDSHYKGSLTWYAAGNIANGNFQNTGDRIVTATGNGTVVLSGTQDISKSEINLFPNPGSEQINIVFKDETSPEGTVIFYDVYGQQVAMELMEDGVVNTSRLLPGVYLIQIISDHKSFFVKWSKI